MRSNLSLRRAAACIVLFASACSTTIKTTSDDPATGSAEREALRAAAAEVADTPWPKPSSSSLADRLAGATEAGGEISRDDAVKAYAERLKASPSAKSAILSDADRHLDAARALMKVAEKACDSPSPRLSDVALIEDAISDLRETRSIYIASIKKIDVDDDLEDRIKDSFDAVIKDLGDVADELAEKAMKKNSEAFAGPNSTVAAGSS